MPIMTTVILENGDIDIESTNRLVDYLLDAGAVAIGHLGGASEHGKIAAEDRLILIKTVVERVKGRVPVFIGAASNSMKGAILNAKNAQELGADMIMLCSPTTGNCKSEELYGYYKNVCNAVNLPVIVQDTGPSANTYTAEFICRLYDTIENVGYVKSESGNYLAKTDKMNKITGGDMPIIGGAAGNHMIQLLRLGVTAFMTGTEAQEIHNAVVQAWLSGNEDLAVDLYFTTLLPYLQMYTTNNRTFCKYMLHRRGIIANPSPLFPPDYEPADAVQYRELEWILDRIEHNKIKG